MNANTIINSTINCILNSNACFSIKYFNCWLLYYSCSLHSNKIVLIRITLLPSSSLYCLSQFTVIFRKKSTSKFTNKIFLLKIKFVKDLLYCYLDLLCFIKDFLSLLFFLFNLYLFLMVDCKFALRFCGSAYLVQETVLCSLLTLHTAVNSY